MSQWQVVGEDVLEKKCSVRNSSGISHGCRARVGARPFHPIGHRARVTATFIKAPRERASAPHSCIHAPRDGSGVSRSGMAEVTVTSSCRDCSASNSTASSAHLRLDEDEELLKYIWSEYLHPKQYEWVLIVGYIIVFLCSLIGNTLGKFQIGSFKWLPDWVWD